jgi:hypothetical protein
MFIGVPAGRQAPQLPKCFEHFLRPASRSAVVQAKKDFAQQNTGVSGIEYRSLKSTDADKRHYRVLM